MKKIIIFILSLVLIFGAFNFVDARATRVKGYIKRSTGRYIAPHFKTSPNRTKFDNFSTKGNYNPYTGKRGTVNPWKW
jgi:hypothetical protein